MKEKHFLLTTKVHPLLQSFGRHVTSKQLLKLTSPTSGYRYCYVGFISKVDRAAMMYPELIAIRYFVVNSPEITYRYSPKLNDKNRIKMSARAVG